MLVLPVVHQPSRSFIHASLLTFLLAPLLSSNSSRFPRPVVLPILPIPPFPFRPFPNDCGRPVTRKRERVDIASSTPFFFLSIILDQGCKNFAIESSFRLVGREKVGGNSKERKKKGRKDKLSANILNTVV